MRLNATQVKQTLSQFDAQVLPDDHPAVTQLSGLFGDHTFFLDGAGLKVLELSEAPETDAKTKPMSNGGHWAFQPVQNPEPPSVKDSSWPHSDIDRFILAKLEEKGIKPVQDADKYIREALKYLDALEAEHVFWMQGADRLKPGQAFRRVVMMPEGVVLNRYWDDRRSAAGVVPS